jgi:hypothetical protein
MLFVVASDDLPVHEDALHEAVEGACRQLLMDSALLQQLPGASSHDVMLAYVVSLSASPAMDEGLIMNLAETLRREAVRSHAGKKPSDKANKE